MSKRHSPALYIMALALLMVNVEVGAEQTPFPKLTGRVVDQAGILSESVEGPGTQYLIPNCYPALNT